MRFSSTRNLHGESVDFGTAVLSGLAPDGGLYHPTSEPDLRALIHSIGAESTFVDVAGAMIQALFPERYDAASARRLALTAFPFEPRLTRLEPGIIMLELFHGPSCAFKDFGASFLAATMEEQLTERGEHAIILTATSGDTGSAVVHAFHGRKHIDVAILYPSGRVSPLQEQQLTTLGGNATSLEINGSFDDCQRMVKEAFTDPVLQEKLRLTSANSINVGRLIPQSFYYLWAFAQLKEQIQDELVFCVPSGNFGNLTAGVLAWRWGMPIADFIAVTNANDVVPEYLETGVFRPRPSIETLANAMDVGNPSNFERLEAIFSGGVPYIGSVLSGAIVDDDTIRTTMDEVYRGTGTFVCPHTATGVYAAKRRLAQEPGSDTTVVTLGTAHPAKFLEVCRDAIGEEPDIPERLAKLMKLPKRSIRVENTLDALRSVLMERYST